MALNELMRYARSASQTADTQTGAEPPSVQMAARELQAILVQLSSLDPQFRRFIQLEVTLLSLSQAEPLASWQVNDLQRILRLSLKCALTPPNLSVTPYQLARADLIAAVGELLDVVDERAEECEVASALEALMALFGVDSDLVSVALVSSRVLGKWMQFPTVSQRIASLWERAAQ